MEGEDKLTVSDNCVIFSLSEHNNPLSLCVEFGQSLGFLHNFLNILSLQPVHRIVSTKCNIPTVHKLPL